MGEADLSFLIPSEHRVDGFAQLSAATFVDTAGVDPDPLEARPLRLGASVGDFGGA